MLTESEILSLNVLKNKFEKNPNTYHLPKEIGEDELFLSRSTNTFRPTMSAGGVLGNLHRKSLIDLIILVEDVHVPLRLYRINSDGIAELNRINDSVRIELEKLERACRGALEYANGCIEKLKRYKTENGLE